MQIDKDWTPLCVVRDSLKEPVSNKIPTEVDIMEYFCMWLDHELKDEVKSRNARYVFGRLIEIKQENICLKKEISNLKQKISLSS